MPLTPGKATAREQREPWMSGPMGPTNRRFATGDFPAEFLCGGECEIAGFFSLDEMTLCHLPASFHPLAPDVHLSSETSKENEKHSDLRRHFAARSGSSLASHGSPDGASVGDFRGITEMKRFAAGLRKFASREEGATMVEYGLMVAVIAVVVIVGAGLLGTNVGALFNSVATKITAPA